MPDEPDTHGTGLRVVLADDHRVVRSGLRHVLEDQGDITVVAEGDDVPSAIAALTACRPDVLVLDLNMPGEPSLQALPKIRAASPETRIVILTMQQDPAFAREALRGGAAGYVLKDAADDELVLAVREAAAGRTYLHPAMGARIATEPEAAELPGDLSARELDVLRLIALGHTNTEIGVELHLSVRTVESHRSHIQRKLDCSTRAELVRYALEHGILAPANANQ